ncbi:MAG: hypothetical protein EB079_00835 [Verrucomicrobia bacterium]|nr:hypothetical protein [Verrucomicrobiota bacterium]
MLVQGIQRGETLPLVKVYQVELLSAVTITNPFSFQGEVPLGVTSFVFATVWIEFFVDSNGTLPSVIANPVV